jgi:rRNA small subunit pseudouridine methyltransferase Nep1
VILVLAEASLELVPQEIAGHPAVLADARRRGKRPGELLLDRARHHRAMASLPNAHKRGRPDIVHQVLLAYQFSLLNLKGLGRLYIHTIADYVIEVDPATRPPKNYYNFVGLMEQLLLAGRVPPRGRPLMSARRIGLRRLLESLGREWVVLHEEGRRVDPLELGKTLAGSVVVVGGFPHGDFDNKWLLAEAAGVYKIGDMPLDAAQAVYRAVALAELALGLL